MAGTESLTSRTALTANIAPTPEAGADAVSRLGDLLARSRLDDFTTQVPGELSLDRAFRETAAGEGAAPLIAWDLAPEAPGFRVFRREAPVAAPMLPLSTAPWARGALAAESVGPFAGPDGRRFWFDFFPFVILRRLYLAGDPTPVLLYHESIHLLGFGNANSHDLVKSSIWIRADLLAPGAPAGGYVGLRIEGGRLTFSTPPSVIGGSLTMAAGSHCTVDLRLTPSSAPPTPPGQMGVDASDAELETPDSLSFDLSASGATITALSDASWRLYAQKLDFAWNQGSLPVFQAPLQSVVVPFSPPEAAFDVRVCKSPFATLAGSAPVLSAGWTLPVAQLDVNNPAEAAGDGGFAVQTSDGLTLSWLGLHDGPIRLPSPYVFLSTGLIAIVDPIASNLYSNERLLLWMDGDSKFRSEMDLRFTDSFALFYFSAADGNEYLLAGADVDAKLDRPVDVEGVPFPVHTDQSLFSLAYSDQGGFASVYDDHILVESLAPGVKWPVHPGEQNSLAIRNALFTITPVNSLFLFGALTDLETVGQGVVTLGMGLYNLLPTLPDPYAAHVTWLRRDKRGGVRFGQPANLLLGTVGWAPAVGDANLDAVTTGFLFAPLGSEQAAIAAWTQAASQQEAMTPAAAVVAAPEAATFASIGPRPNQPDWDQYFGRFADEQFALLDVSTNADQMGVSFAWLPEDARNEKDLIFYKVFKPVAASQQPAYPVQVQDLDLSAQCRFVRAFALPEVSWEPLLNLTPPQIPGDPPIGWNLYPDDGGATRIFTDSTEVVPIEPLPVAEFLVQDFKKRSTGFTGALFTLPFGLRAFAEFSRTNQFDPGHTHVPPLAPSRMDDFRPAYQAGALIGALQIRVDASESPARSPSFAGATLQLNNVLSAAGVPTLSGTLGADVATIFNKEFFYDPPAAFKPTGVPLSRIDFCGYGASIFSHWEDPTAAIAATSKAYFDVFGGRTAEEVIQVRSILYPWGVHVVRTITMTRASDAYVFRFDTGWQAESDGIYDFRYTVLDPSYSPQPRPNPYEFHPGLVKGVFTVRNIQDATGIPQFKTVWNKAIGDTYIDSEGIERTVDSSTPSDARNPQVILQPVYFDADAQIDNVVAGAQNGRVQSKGMLGYVQLAPRGEPLSPTLFSAVLGTQFGALGGPVQCVIDAGKSGQQVRINRADVNASSDGAKPIFVSAARGAVALPKEGSWSVVQHNQGTGEVSPLDPQAAVPVIRRGKLLPDASGTDTTSADLTRIANPVDLVTPPGPNTRNYGFLQSTNTQKALFRLPSFQDGVNELKSLAPDFADSYRLINTKGIFPAVQDAFPLVLGAFKTQILSEGYKLLDAADPAKVFQQALPPGPLYLVNEDFLKIYAEYENNDKDGNNLGPGTMNYGFDATAASLADQWLSKLSDIAMVVDLGGLKRLVMVKGGLEAEKGSDASFKQPQLVFSKELQPVIDILQILEELQGGDYAAAFKKGLEIAMSNSADSWNYAFHARKEIPVVKFPPGIAYDNPTNPLKLEAHLAVGVYFNEVFQIPSAPEQLIPSAGAFLEFGGSLSVMCVSLAAATIYAVGSVDLRIAADIKTGPSLHMKFGFGAEIAVGLPVIGTVSLLYMVGIQIDLDTGSITVAGFLLFRGRAELLGGLVTVQIQIEAKGMVHRQFAPGETDLIAQVTFGLDISIFLVINLHFSKSWQESRQIA